MCLNVDSTWCVYFFSAQLKTCLFFLNLTKKNLAQKSHLSWFFFTHSCDGKKNSSSAREFSACLGFFFLLKLNNILGDRHTRPRRDCGRWCHMVAAKWMRTQDTKSETFWDSGFFSCVFHLTKLGWAEGEVEQKKDWNRVKIWKWFIDASCAPIS